MAETVQKRVEMNNLEGIKSSNNGKEESAMAMALSTPDILAQILSHIKPKLQEYRLVNRVWNEVILRQLPRRVKLSFNFEPRSYINRRPHFEAQVDRVKSLNIQNFCVMLSPRNLPREAIKDIGWFMKNYGNKMKSLDLTFWLINPSSYSMLSNIFKHLSKVEEMILKVTFAKDAEKGERWPSPITSVRKVGFKTVDFSAGCLEPALVLNLMKLYPNMESLTVYPPKFSCHALNCVVEDKLQLPKLNELHIWLDGESTDSTTKILERLAKIPNHLQILSMECFPAFDCDMIAAMEKVLQRHGPSLKALRIEKLYAQKTKSDNDNESCICFPKFPQLRRFKLSFRYCTEQDETCQPLTIKFSGGTISYEKDFPVLEDLQVCTDCEDSVSPCLNNLAEQMFLPCETTTKSVRMKRMEMTIPEDWIQDCNHTWGDQFLKKFKTIFPNASLMPMEKIISWLKSERHASY